MSLKQRYRILALLAAIAGMSVVGLWLAAIQREPTEVGRSYCMCPGEWVGQTNSICSSQFMQFQVYPTFAPTRCGLGVHYSGQPCFGTRKREIFPTGVGTHYRDTCQGIPLGEKECYGIPVPLTSTFDLQFQRVPCDYTCNDETITSLCRNQDKVVLPHVTLDCWALRQICE